MKTAEERRQCFDKFLSKIKYERIGNSCDVPINKSKGHKGYIMIKFSGFCKLHRAVYYYYNGLDHFTPAEWQRINKRKVVRHTCDNPSCVNSNHLLIGTQQDNVLDRVARNRSASREKNGNAKLSQIDVDFIRYYHKTHLNTEIAKFLGVNVSTVKRIVGNKNWMPLPTNP